MQNIPGLERRVHLWKHCVAVFRAQEVLHVSSSIPTVCCREENVGGRSCSQGNVGMVHIMAVKKLLCSQSRSS